MQHHSTRRTAVTAGVALTGLIAAPSAHAAFFPAGQLTGADTAPGIVTGTTAGQVAVAGADYDGGLSAAAHAPGGAFGATSPVATGTEDDPATLGTGGAITGPGPVGFVARRLRPNGTVSGTVPVGTPGSTAIGTPAVAPGGALLAAVFDAVSGNLQLWRQAGDGQPAVPLAASLPQNVNMVDIEPIGPDAFVVLVASPTDAGDGVALRSVTVTGTTVSAPRAVDDITEPDSGLSLLRAIPGTSQFALYVATVGATSVLRASALTGPAGPPKDITSVTGDDSIDDVRGLALPGGGAAVAWTKSDEEGAVTAAYAVLDAAGNKTCEVAEPLTAVALVDRGGPVLVGIDAASRIVTVPVAAGCPVGTPTVGPAVPNAYELGAAVDADGTLVAVVAPDDGSPATIVVDDTTPPVVEAIDAPEEVRPDRDFDVTAAAFDPWGVAARTWSVNGKTIPGTGASTTVPGQPLGTAKVATSVRNTAGLTATRSTDVQVRADAPATPTPPRTPPTTTQQPTSTTVPSGSRDTIAPRLSGVRIDRSLVRPLRATSALPRGATVRFTVSETARYRVTLLREALVPGARSRCDVPSGARGSSRKGQLHELKGSARAGTVRLRITGRDAQGKRLPRGRYRVSVRAIDAAGNWSATKYVRLTIC